MKTTSLNRPPLGPFPAAGFWVKILADAIAVGLSDSERAKPEIRAALEYLGRNRTAQRTQAGETASAESWAATVVHLEALLLVPEWMPQHGCPQGSIGPMLGDAPARWEHLATDSTIVPNLDGALTRAGLRSMIALAAVLVGVTCRETGGDGLEFRPWHPRRGLGDVLDSLRRSMQPPLTRAALCDELRLSTASWDRLRRGIVPPTAVFDFGRFAALAGGDESRREAVEAALRRALAGARLVATMEKSIRVGPGPRAFWDDCWTEFDRVHAIAAALRPGIGGPSGLRGLFPLVAKGAGGHWAHVWRAVQGGNRHYFGLICATLLAVSAWNRKEGQPEKIQMSDAFILAMLDHTGSSPAVQAFLAGADGAVDGGVPASTPQGQGARAAECVRRGDLAAARAAYEACFAASPDSWLARYQLAWFECRHGDPKRTLTLLADSRLSVHHEYHAVLGKAHHRLNHHRQALAAFETSIRREDSLLLCYELAASCARELGDKVKARTYEKLWHRLREKPAGHRPRAVLSGGEMRPT